MGHTVQLSRSHIGRTNSIQLDGPWRFGYADPRRTGGHVAR
jgi:gamma-glutamyltranspeptidase/glutathione hydrolase